MDQELNEYRIEQLENEIESLHKKLDSISEQLTKYKGFVGGVMFVFTCLGTALGFALKYITFKSGG